MAFEQQIADGIKKAMLARDEKTLRGLRAIKSEILSLKTSSGFSGQITQNDEIKILQKLIKQRKESLDIYKKQNREDLASKEQEEIDVIQPFLPRQLSQDEITEAVKSVISGIGATSMKDMGRVMGVVNKNLSGKADGTTVASVVKQLLSGK